MAKTKKTGAKKAGKRVHSTARGAETRKRKPDKPAPVGGEETRNCCTPAMVALSQFFATAPSGSIVTIEDGFPVLIEPPTVASYLAIDPGGSGMPYWEPA